MVLVYFNYFLNSFSQTPVSIPFQFILLNPCHFQTLIPPFSLNLLFPYFYLILPATLHSFYYLSTFQYILKFQFHHFQFLINHSKSTQLWLLLYCLEHTIIILLFTIQHTIPNYSYHHFLPLPINYSKSKKPQLILSFF